MTVVAWMQTSRAWPGPRLVKPCRTLRGGPTVRGTAQHPRIEPRQNKGPICFTRPAERRDRCGVQLGGTAPGARPGPITRRERMASRCEPNADYALVADSAFAAVNQRRISVLFFGRADLAACKSLYARRCRAFGSQTCQAVLRAEPAESRARRGRNISHTRRTASTGTASARAASTWRRNLLQNVPLGPCSTHLHRDGLCVALRLFPVAVTHSRLRGLFSNGAVSTAAGARPGPFPA